MKKDKLVFIDGKPYDSVTGMPVANIGVQPAHKVTRKINDFKVSPKIKSKNISTKTLPEQVIKKTYDSRVMDIARSKSISHFASNKISNLSKPSDIIGPKKSIDIGPMKHPLANKASKVIGHNIKKTSEAKTSKEVKESAIRDALAKQPIIKNHIEKRVVTPKQRLAILITSVILLIAGLSYVAYIYLPSFSVKIAGAQAGINAKYPEYKPDGYRINGPVSYDDKEVVINFKANAGENEYSIKQAKSSWDSSALREKVEQESKGSFSTTSINGLTIYTYGHTSKWVSGGILFTINGDADLLSDQIHRIAVSL